MANIQDLRAVIFNVGEIAPPAGDFMRCGGDFVICEIWGATSVSRGAISAGLNTLKF